MKVLVTGGLGFIGSHTVTALVERGFQPVIADNLSNSRKGILNRIERIVGQKIPFYEIDCTDQIAMAALFSKESDTEAVIHFAALKAVGESMLHPLTYYRNNLDALLMLLENMAKYKVPYLVFSSSATVYGQPENLPVSEDSPIQKAMSPYGATKIMSEEIIADTVRTIPEMECTSLRYFNPIGAHPTNLIGELPQGTPNNLVPYITQTATGKQEKLKIFGNDYNTPDGSCQRDYVHVMDLANAHVLAIEQMQQRQKRRANNEELSPRMEYINVGCSKPVSVLQIVKDFEKANGVTVPYEIAPRRAGDVDAIWADTQKSKEMLGWTPQYTLEDALKHAYEWEKSLEEDPIK